MSPTQPPGVLNAWPVLPDLADPTTVGRAKVAAIADAIESSIRKGLLRQGQQVPGTTHIARRYGVNTTYAHRALRQLADRGLVRVIPTVGTFVTGTGADR